MAFRGSKRKYPFEKSVDLGYRGVNAARLGHLIDDSEVQDAVNWWISPEGRVSTRWGVDAFLDEPLPDGVKGIWHYHAGNRILAAAGNKLYSAPLTGGEATLLGTLNLGSATYPITGANFQGNFFVAAGGKIQYFDGTEIKDITKDANSNDVPESAAAVFVWLNRLWIAEANSSTIHYSGALDFTDWGRSSGAPEGEGLLLNGGSFSVNANDGGYITGLSTFNGQLVAFKNGPRPSIHRILGMTSESFEPDAIAYGLSISDARNVVDYDVDTFFGSDNGVYSMRIVGQVGNTESIPLSLKIRSHVRGALPRSMAFDTALGYLLVVMTDGDVWVFHPSTESWFRWVLTDISATVAASINGSVMWGASDGQIYIYKESVNQDNGAIFYRTMVDKSRDFGSTRNLYINDIVLDILYHTDGDTWLEVYNNYGNQKVARKLYSSQGTEGVLLDEGLLDDMFFDSDAVNQQVLFEVELPLNDCTLVIKTSAKVVLANACFRGSGMHKRGVEI